MCVCFVVEWPEGRQFLFPLNASWSNTERARGFDCPRPPSSNTRCYLSYYYLLFPPSRDAKLCVCVCVGARLCMCGHKTKSVLHCCRFESHFINRVTGVLVAGSVVDPLDPAGGFSWFSPFNLNHIDLTKLPSMLKFYYQFCDWYLTFQATFGFSYFFWKSTCRDFITWWRQMINRGEHVLSFIFCQSSVTDT